jgi:hypothetical protein
MEVVVLKMIAISSTMVWWVILGVLPVLVWWWWGWYGVLFALLVEFAVMLIDCAALHPDHPQANIEIL